MKKSDLKPYLAQVREFIKKVRESTYDGLDEVFAKGFPSISATRAEALKKEKPENAFLIHDIAYQSVRCGLSDKQIEAMLDIAELLED